MKRLILLLLAPLLTGCFLVPTSPDVQYADVTIEVLDQQGLPVEGARVEAWGGYLRTDRRNVAYTDSAGTVHFSLPPWHYQIYVHPPTGYDHVPPARETGFILPADPSVNPIIVTVVVVRSS